jgi:hypothetical protein
MLQEDLNELQLVRRRRIRKQTTYVVESDDEVSNEAMTHDKDNIEYQNLQ